MTRSINKKFSRCKGIARCLALLPIGIGLFVQSTFWNILGLIISLLLFALVGGAGMLLFANPLLYLLERYPLVLRWFFIGAVAGSTPMMLKKAQIHSVSWRLPVFLVDGFSAGA